MNEDEQVIWGQPVSFQDFVQGFQVTPNQRRVELVPKVDPQKFYTREKVAPPSQDQGEIRDANKERVNKSLSNYASNNFLLSTSNIRPDQNGRYNPGLGQFAGDQTALTLSMGFDPFNASNYYKVATQIPKFRNWGLTRLLANELNNEVRVAGELGKNVGSVSKTQFVLPQFKNVTRTVQDNGKIRLSLPSHTDANPRQFVLEPQGNNKFYVHMRTWDGDHIPANLSNEDKQTLFQALYDELPEGGEILFPKSGPGYYGTRGTVARLQRLSRDSRFTPGTKGTLQYLDKDGTIKTYEGTSFIKKSFQEPKTSLKFFERPQSRISEAERTGIPRGERNLKNPSYTLKDARKEAQEFAEKWGYDFPENASLKDIEDLYNRHNTFFRGTTTEYFDVEKDRIAKELGLKTLTPEQFLQYSATHSHPGTDRIWVTPFDHYSGFYGTVGEGFQGQGQVSAVMRPWKTPKLKDWKEKASWELGFKEDINNPVITPWVERSPGATIDRGPQTELLIKGPLIYRGLAKDFKGTLQNKLNYSRIKDLREPYLPQPPQEITVNFKSGGNIIKRFKNRNKL